MPFRFGGDKIGTNLKHDIMKKWIWIGVVAVVVIFFYATYNGFVNKEEGLKTRGRTSKRSTSAVPT